MVTGLLAAAALPGAAGAVVPLDAEVVPFEPQQGTASFPSIDYGKRADPKDDRHAQTTWRIVEGTGNCCETYLTTTARGRLLDFGGSTIKFSDDRGSTWKEVRPMAPLVNGEGAIAAAPGGDVLGVEWDPYSGDRLQFYKYEADTDKWQYTEMPLHQPFYDREWIAVIPGPVTIGGTEHDYVSFVKGGLPKEAWFYSTDGLRYTGITSKGLETMLSESGATTPLPTAADDDNDWNQPNTNGAMTGFAGGLLADADFPFSGWSLLDSQFKWSAYSGFPDGTEPAGRYQVDAAGRIHNVKAGGSGFTYRMSSDHGATWTDLDLPLPKYHLIEEWDFRANKAAGVAAVAVRAFDDPNGTDQDFAFKLDINGAAPRLLRRYEVGSGDLDATGGVGNDVRFDFGSVSIFPDGRLAVSFLDGSTTLTGVRGSRSAPAIAVELDTALGRKAHASENPAPRLGTPYASFSFDAGAEGWTSSTPGWARSSPGAKNGVEDTTTQSFGITGTQYVDNLDMLEVTVTSPPVETEEGQTVVEFWNRLDIEDGFDYVDAEFSLDGKNWVAMAQLTGRTSGTDDPPEWRKVTLDFDSPGGTAQVRFRFRSDDLCSNLTPCEARLFEGARVDEVVIGRQAR